MAAPEKNKAAERKKLQKSYFDVLGLCCSSEVPLIENILRNLDGVVEFTVIVPTRTVIVLHDHLLLSQLQIAKALNQARLEANVRAYGDTNYKKKWPSPFVVLSGILLLLSLLKYVFHPLRWLALGAVAVGIYPICMKAFASIRSLRLDTNILVLIAVVGTIAMKDYTEAGTIVFLFTVAQWLESRASHKANVVMSSLMSIAPQKAVIAETGEEVDADEVKINTVLSVKAGEVIPIDGIVVDGKCEVDEKTLTGESFPVPKEKDSTVWAGTINLNGYISVKTTALAKDCVVAKMANLVEEAQKCKSKTQRFIDKCAQYYTPAIIIISASLAVIPLALRVRNRSYWFHLALVVLVSACPCALILSTPVATFCALMKAATAGLLIKGGEVLETLAKIKIVAFDKTGTITRGEFVVRDFQSLYPDISLNTLLYWVSSIESKSGHPMAAALVDYGRSLSIEPNPENVQDFQNFPGEGICGKIDGKDIYIGNRKIALRAECKSVPTLEDDSKRGKSIGYIYSGANPVGIFCLSDACRSGVAEAIKDLKQLGIRTSMLTGDNQEAAMHAQEELRHALDEVHAELLPEDKARIIKEFKKEGATAMIGDGLNDAPALATADIGISMGISGSALANETGNVILMSNDIRKVTKVIQLARKAHRKIIENVIFSISTKAAILALAFAGHPLVWAAVLADTGTCLLVLLNSMLILRETKKHVGKCCKNSSAQHTHKHVNQLSSQDHKHCCSNTNIKKLCKLQVSQSFASRCESNHPSMNSCKSIKCTDSTKRSDECTDKDDIHETEHCSHGICITSDCDLELNDPHNHVCSTFHTSSLRVRQKCKNSDWLHEARHCHHHALSETVTHQVVSDHSTGSDHRKCHSNHCCDEEHTGTKNSLESLGDIVESSCNHGHQPMDHDHDKCCERLSNSLHTAINVQPSENHTETSTMHACMSLEKREIGGCCKSYMKECCGNHGHFAPLICGSVGGLSEIITE